MSNWCQYCVDRSTFFTTYYKCNKNGREEDIPEDYVKWYCGDENTAYVKCPIYNRWYVTTMTSNILKMDKKKLSSLYALRDKVQSDERYSKFTTIYDTVGPVIANKLISSEDKEEKASKISSRLDSIAKLVDSNKIDIAAKKYMMMTLRLVCEYELRDLYRSTRDNIKITKRLDK